MPTPRLALDRRARPARHFARLVTPPSRFVALGHRHIVVRIALDNVFGSADGDLRLR
jgi:hypothetical protein